MSHLEQKSFIADISPFDRLSKKQLEMAADAMDMAYFSKGERLISHGSCPVYLFIIIKGVVHETNDEGLVSVHLAQDTFDAMSLINNSCQHDFTVQEELICYLLPKEIFLTLVHNNADFRCSYYQNLSERLNTLIEQRHSKELASFMVAKISEAYIHPPVFVEAQTSIYQSVQTLRKCKADSLLVKNSEKVGIVTNSDIQEAVVLKRQSVDTPIGNIANYNLISMRNGDFLFNALLTMTKHTINRVVIYNDDNQEIIGVLEQMDLLSYFSNHSHLIAVQIEQATSTSQLKKASQNLTNVIQTLYMRGVKIRYISQLVNELNKKVFEKLYALIAPPELIANSCLIVMGSEGRSEQILKTDQDNALILRDGYECVHLTEIAQQLTECLIDFGYPPCHGHIMVNNPYWCKPLRAFQSEIYQWMQDPKEDSLMNLAIFYDASAVAGDDSLLKSAKDYLFSLLQDNKPYFSHFAKPVLAFETPLGLFANLIVEKAHHKDQLDIKKGGIFPIMHGIRSLALENKLMRTNTIERIKILNEKGVFDKEFAIELIEAYAFINGVRLHAELEKVKLGQPYDNYINPNEMSKLERDLLKDAFRIVNDFKKFITYHFKLNLVS